ncbi:MAG: LysM domain-containing protein [Bacteroidota bacterium]|nr:LysM domain-containing protein [Bacteroidota bacterium]
MKKIFFITLMFSISLNSQEKIDDFLSNYDSIINHTVQKKETLFSLSKKYGLSIDEIIKANPGIQTDKLKRRSVLVIPLKKKNVAKEEINIIVDSIKKDSIILSDLKSNDLTKEKFKKIDFELAFLAPFKLNTVELDSVENTEKTLGELNLTTISINFYNGLTYAIKELKDLGINVSLSVYDTENDLNKIDQLKSLDLKKFDLIIGPFIARNFNKFNSYNSSLIVSPLIENGISVKENVIITTTNNSLKSSHVFDIIDSEITLMEDQCAIIISDSENISSKSKLISRFPNAEVVDIDNENLFVDPEITDSLMGYNKQNWVFLETSKTNVISSVASLLNSQNNNDRKIRLFSTVSSENYENSNISLEKLGNLNFIYPSNSKPSTSFEYSNFYENYIEKYGNEPDRISIKARDLTYDLILRIAVFKKFENSLQYGETTYFQNKFDYSFKDSFYRNKSFFILRHRDLEILEIQEPNNEQ